MSVAVAEAISAAAALNPSEFDVILVTSAALNPPSGVVVNSRGLLASL